MTLQLVEAARILQLDPAQGWPQTITPERLGALQAWRKGLDTKTLRIDTRNWSKAIKLALVAGGIEHTTTTERVQVVELQDHELFAPIPLASDEWLGRDFGHNSKRTTQAAHKTVTHHHITAPAFAAWLAAQGEEPSAHIAAWFNAVGAAPAAVPTVEGIAERNARWLAVTDEEKRIGPELGAQARAIRRIVASEDVTEGTVKKGIQKAEKTRADGYRAGKVTPINTAKPPVNSVFNMVKPKGRAAR